MENTIKPESATLSPTTFKPKVGIKNIWETIQNFPQLSNEQILRGCLAYGFLIGSTAMTHQDEFSYLTSLTRKLFSQPEQPISATAEATFMGVELNPLPFEQIEKTEPENEPKTVAQTVEQPNIEQKVIQQSKADLIKKAVVRELGESNESVDVRRLTNTLTWVDLLELIVKDPRLQIAEKDRAGWILNMLALTHQESGGRPQASSGIAFGLTQLLPSTADEIARQYQIPQHNLENSWDNTFLGLAYQLNMTSQFGKELGITSHFIGPGNTKFALRTYFISVLKLPVNQVDAVLNSNKILAESVDFYQITPSVLFNSPAVSGALKEKGISPKAALDYYNGVKGAEVLINRFIG